MGIFDYTEGFSTQDPTLQGGLPEGAASQIQPQPTVDRWDISRSTGPAPSEPPPPEAPKSKSIMERMQALGSWLVDPLEQGNVHSSPLARLGQTMQGVGQAVSTGGKDTSFWQNQLGMEEKLRSGKVDRDLAQKKFGLEEKELGLRIAEGQRKDKAASLKEKAFSQLEKMDIEKGDMSMKNLLKLAGPLMAAGDTNAGMDLLKLGMTLEQNKGAREELATVQRHIAVAKTGEEAQMILSMLSPEVQKEHGSFLMQLVKMRFPEAKEKGMETNQLADFVATQGRQRGPTVPENLSVSEAQKMLTERRSMQQQQINVGVQQQGYRRAADVRDDFAKQTKRYGDVRIEYDKLEKMMQQKTPVADLALIRQAMKAMDPTSTVRETEAQMVEDAKANPLWTGLLPHLQNKIAGRSLNETQRKDIYTLGKSFYQAERRRYDEQRSYYGGVADREGIDRERALGAELPPLTKEQKPTSVTVPKYKVTEVK